MHTYTFTRRAEARTLFSDEYTGVDATLDRATLDTEAHDLENLFDAVWELGLIEGNTDQPIISAHHSDLAGVDWTVTTRVGEYPAQFRIATNFDWKALPSDAVGADLAVAAIETVVEHLNIELRALDAYVALSR